jgi:hypothetical protein
MGLKPDIVGYNVWRRVGAGGAAVPPSGWEVVQSFLPTGQVTYTVAAATRADSSAEGSAEELYSVTAHTLNPTLVLPSEATAGNSVDNLAPEPPENLAGSRMASGTVRLSWDAGSDADLARYAVYRGDSASFVPSPANRIGQTVAPTWDDAGFQNGLTNYKVTAVDRCGNESATALLAPYQMLDVMPAGPLVSAVRSLAPNPMRASMTLSYGLARAGRVSVAVFDPSGRRVRMLVDAREAAGERHVQWNRRDDQSRLLPAGLYLVRIIAPGIECTRKIIAAD